MAPMPTPAVGSIARTPAPAPASRASDPAAVAALPPDAAVRSQFQLTVGLYPPMLGPPPRHSPAPGASTKHHGTAHFVRRTSVPAQGAATAPDAPLGPPGTAAAAGIAAAFGGGSTGHSLAIISVLLAFGCQLLRRHRARLAPPGPVGVAFLLQRPG